MKCQKCDHEIRDSDLFCYNCGSKVIKEEKETKKIYCHICNNIIHENDNYCQGCGAKLNRSSEDDIDIISSRVNIVNNQQNKESNLVLIISLISVGISFIFSGFIPTITLILSLGAFAFAIFKLIKSRNKITGWSVALTTLAIMLSGLNVVNELIAKEYAFETRDRIYEITSIKLPEADPSFYNISMIDGEVVKVNLTNVLFNDVVYQLNDIQANEFETMINTISVFNGQNVSYVKEEFKFLLLEGTDVSLIYNIDNDTYDPTEGIKNKNLIIINYDCDSKVIQVLEIGVMVE